MPAAGEHDDARRPVSLDVSAWTLVQPTRLILGTTIELGGRGALIRFEGLPKTAGRIELRIALPERDLLVSATVAARRPPDLFEVSFHGLNPNQRERLMRFLRAPS
jgi:PilZ domain